MGVQWVADPPALLVAEDGGTLRLVDLAPKQEIGRTCQCALHKLNTSWVSWGCCFLCILLHILGSQSIIFCTLSLERYHDPTKL